MMAGVVTLRTIAELRARLDADRAARAARVGLVPDHGLPPRGPRLAHRAARPAECDVVVATIFVNPLQFGAGRGPRVVPARPRRATPRWPRRPGVDVVFAPDRRGDVPRRRVLTTVRSPR